ncbi:MAG: hypothetical protein L3J69_14485 [Desulfobacula sp.]|nr:hypothetical protein [Desulfobacula sp.]
MKNNKILIADDEKAIRKFFHIALEQKGYTVFSAEYAKAAFRNILKEN